MLMIISDSYQLFDYCYTMITKQDIDQWMVQAHVYYNLISN